jgi:hypothetical protein
MLEPRGLRRRPAPIGMNVELEQGLHDPRTNISDDNPHVTAMRSRSPTSTSSPTTTRGWMGWRKKPSAAGSSAIKR